MTSRSRLHLATKTCSIKRINFDTSNGQTDLPAGHIADIPCTPLMSIDETGVTASREQSVGSAMVGRKQIMIFREVDIQRGDILVLDGREYPIVEANPWSIAEPFLTLIVNEIQANHEVDAVFVR